MKVVRLRPRSTRPQLPSDSGDPGIAFGPVMSTSGEEQAHSLAVPADGHPVTVMLDLVAPSRSPTGGLVAKVGMQGSTKPAGRTRGAAMPLRYRFWPGPAWPILLQRLRNNTRPGRLY